jgi:hypothetical protein
VSINLLHEALETFLVAAAEHLNVSLKMRTDFATYLDKLDEVLAPQRLPFRTTLIRLNKARVQAKHDSITPDRAELPNFVASTHAFLEESTKVAFQIDFTSVSLVDLIENADVKEKLSAAQSALEGGRYIDVLVECRKAVYLVFEKPFDVSIFADDTIKLNAFAGMICRAPAYAKSKNYIHERVLDPFDFIVLDHSVLDSELVKDGLDPLIFWNIWRLTPQVFQTKEGSWLVRNEPDKTAGETAQNNAPYVLENTISLIHQRERKRRGLRTPTYNKWTLRVRTPGAKIYRKASFDSEIVGEVRLADEYVQVSVGTPDFENRESFWRVFYVEQSDGSFVSGYIREVDLAFD